MLGCSCWAARRSCGRWCLPCCFGMLRLLADIELQCNEEIRGPESSSAFRCCRQVDDLQSRRANTFRCCVHAVWECWGAAAGQREKEQRTLLSTVLFRDVEVAGWHWAAVQWADWTPYFLTFRSCRGLDDLQRERANAFTVGAVSSCVRMLGCSSWGARRSCGGCCLPCCLVVGMQPLSTMLVRSNCTSGELPKKLCWRAVNGKVSQQSLWYASSKTMSIQPLLCCSYCCRPAKEICFCPDLYIIHRPWTSGN